MFSLTVSQFIMGYIVMYLNPMNIIIFLSYFFNYKYYYLIEDKETSHRILKKLGKDVVTFCTKISHGKQQLTGGFIGWNCIGYIDNYSYEDTKIYILTLSSFYDSLIEYTESTINVHTELVLPAIENTKIEIMIRAGTYKNIYYRTQRLDLSHMNAIGDQQYIVESIIEFKVEHLYLLMGSVMQEKVLLDIWLPNNWGESIVIHLIQMIQVII